MSGESFYLGAAISQLDRKQTLAAICRSAAPARVRPGARHRARRLGRAAEGRLMSGLAGARREVSSFTRQSSEPWVLANELKREFDVKKCR